MERPCFDGLPHDHKTRAFKVNFTVVVDKTQSLHKNVHCNLIVEDKIIRQNVQESEGVTYNIHTQRQLYTNLTV